MQRAAEIRLSQCARDGTLDRRSKYAIKMVLHKPLAEYRKSTRLGGFARTEVGGPDASSQHGFKGFGAFQCGPV